MRIESIQELRKTQSRWYDESYSMTCTLARPTDWNSNQRETLSCYARKYKEGWCFYSQSQWYLFRKEDQDKINKFHDALEMELSEQP
jgi:hypothetical protein